MGVCICNCSLEGQRQDNLCGSLGSLATKPSVVGGFQATERPISTKRWMTLEEWHPRLCQLYTYIHTHACAPACTWTCIICMSGHKHTHTYRHAQTHTTHTPGALATWPLLHWEAKVIKRPLRKEAGLWHLMYVQIIINLQILHLKSSASYSWE